MGFLFLTYQSPKEFKLKNNPTGFFESRIYIWKPKTSKRVYT
ncbi:hypothetical protein C943_02100 [Mariniradius saccharolyticus AK6]|uniref:Uncharacterized protein n=1 Tax=Mariniradius saccharolyticus AK6 TaxID=1239962 RepID=M7X1T0_9BACT|nr:hypothetical protein C943_02100 [Mariniradius saccharolyticus AK6]